MMGIDSVRRRGAFRTGILALALLPLALAAATPAQATCDLLDGQVASAEECDDGNNLDHDACKNDCTWNVCGDGIACTDGVTQGSKCGVDGPTALEDCDKDGDNPDCDGDCTLVACGDGYPNVVVGEQCDDGNQQADDGCDASCLFGKDQQISALDALKSASLTPVEAWIEDGIPTSVRMQVPIGAAGEDPVVGALAFLNTYRALYKLGDPRTTLFLDRVSMDAGISAMTFGQKVGAVPFRGGELVVLLSDDHEIVGTHGRWNTLLPETAETPQLEPEEAEAAALAEGKFLTADARLRGTTKLVYFDPGFLRTTPGKPRLCWRVVAGGTRFDQQDATADYYVDAFTGQVLEIADRERRARDYDLSTARNDTSSTCFSVPFDDPSVQWFTEDGPTRDYPGRYPGGDGDGDRMYQLTVATYDYWLGRFGRRGSDGSDEQVEAYCHVDNAWRNASAGDYCMMFGDGWVTRDIFGHEYAHTVDQDSCELTYAWESGAVAEALADFFGVAAAGYDDWVLANGATGAASCPGHPSGIRDMSNPPACNGACNMAPALNCPHPDHYSNYRNMPQLSCPSGTMDPCDSGGVHTNSSILNKAFYLLAEGGTHRGVTIGPFGRARTEFYMYRMMTQRLGSSSRMIDVRNEFINAIRGVGDRRPAAMLTPPTALCDVVNAFAVVGLGSSALDSDCDGTPDLGDADSDNDGIPDARDTCDSTPSMNQTDSDGDGFGDLCDGDDDNDEVCDVGGPLPAGSPGVAVQCNAGPSWARDNCPLVANATQADTNRDGLGDACQETQDSDGDGVNDALDNCPALATSVITDVDNDAIGDACDPDADRDYVCNQGGPIGQAPPLGCVASKFGADNCPLRSNYRQTDTDGDSLACADRLAPTHPDYGCGDDCDNCADAANPDQRDLDRDGTGDACDDDRDGDTVPNDSDNCPDVRNRDQVDPNGNGLGWGCDPDDWGAAFNGNGSMVPASLQFPGARLPFEVAIPSCPPPGCASWISPQVERRLLFELSVPLRVQIIDDDGRTVARAGSDLDPMLRFTPDPETYYLAPSVLPAIGAAARAVTSLDADVEAWIGKSYTLRITPDKSGDGAGGASTSFGYGAVVAAKCSAEPTENCKASLKSGKSPLLIKNNGSGGRKLLWKITAAADAQAAEFGSPTTGGTYALCVYDASGEVPHLTSELLVPGGGTCEDSEPCWLAVKPGRPGAGFKFGDRRALHDGMTDIVFKSGVGGTSSLLVKASGSNLRLPALPVPVPLRLQLQASDGACWEASYAQPSVSVNKDGAFGAAGD